MAELLLAIKLTADGKGLVGEVRLSREELEKLRKTTQDGAGASREAADAGGRNSAVLQDLERNGRALGLTIAAVSAAVLVQTRRWIDDAASMERWHQVTGKSVESLASLKYVAEQTNVSFELLMAIYQRLPKSIVEGLGPGSEAGRAFKALAIDPRQLKANDEGMMLIVDRLRQVEDRGTRAAIAQMIFKQRGEDLLLWVNQGAEGIARLTREGERWATITGTDAQRADELKKKINTLTYATDALAKSVSQELVPQLNRMIERMLEGARTTGGLRGAIQGFLTGSDLDKWNADFFRAVERLGSAQINVERLQASGGWMRQGLARAQAELAAARAEVARLQAIKPILAPEAPPRGVQGTAAAGTIRQPTLADLEAPDTAGADLLRSLRDQLAGLDPQVTMVDRVMLQLTDTTNRYTEAERAAAIALAYEIDLRKQEKEALQPYLASAGMDVQTQNEIEDLQRKAGARFEQIRLENLTEQELLQRNLDEKQLAVNAAYEWGLVSAQQQAQQLEQLELQHQAKMGNATAQGVLQRRQIEQMGMRQQAQFYFGQLAEITAAGAQHNRTLFDLNKIAGIANAIMSTYQGAAKALEWGYPLGPVFAGIIVAAGMAQVAAIRATQFGGGTSAPSIGFGAAVPVTPAPDFGAATAPGPLAAPVAAAPKQDVNITVYGRLGAEEIRDLMKQFITEIGYGINLTVTEVT